MANTENNRLKLNANMSLESDWSALCLCMYGPLSVPIINATAPFLFRAERVPLRDHVIHNMALFVYLISLESPYHG